MNFYRIYLCESCKRQAEWSRARSGLAGGAEARCSHDTYDSQIDWPREIRTVASGLEWIGREVSGYLRQQEQDVHQLTYLIPSLNCSCDGVQDDREIQDLGMPGRRRVTDVSVWDNW